MTFEEMGKELLTQDNQATGDPIFVVQQRRRIYGMDQCYTDEEVAWLTFDDSVEADAETHKRLEAQYVIDHNDENEGWRRVGYVDVWEFVQPFFTAKGANEYIAANRHRMIDPRVYVDSAYRNKEWQAMRKFLIAAAKGEAR